MAFGVSGSTTNQTSRSSNTTAQVAYMLNNQGNKVDATTYSTETQVTEEFYVTGGTTTNPVTDGQNGTSVKSNYTLTESNTDYAKYSTTTINIPGGTASNS